MVDATWRVADHGPLEALGKNLWQVEAVLQALPIGRRMVIARQEDGSLVIHNAVACNAETMASIEKLGRIAVLIVPSGFHRIDLPAFAARYPASEDRGALTGDAGARPRRAGAARLRGRLAPGR